MRLTTEQKSNACNLLHEMNCAPALEIADGTHAAYKAFHALPEAARDFAYSALLYSHLAQTKQPIPAWLADKLAAA